MVELFSQVSLRGKRQRERMEKIRAAKPIGGIRVVPTDEKYRKILKHPSNGMGFRAEGSVEWPNDRFTKRRIAEGVIKREDAQAQPPQTQPAEQPVEQPTDHGKRNRRHSEE